MKQLILLLALIGIGWGFSQLHPTVIEGIIIGSMLLGVIAGAVQFANQGGAK